MLYKVILACEPVCGGYPKVWPIEMKAIEQYFPVVLFVMPYKVPLTFDSLYEIVKCGQSNENYWAVFSYNVAFYVNFYLSYLGQCFLL